MMRLGLSSYTYTWAIGVPGQLPENPLSAYGLIDKAQSMQVGCVQIADNLPLHRLAPEELLKLAGYAESKNVAIEIGTKGLTADNVNSYIPIARTFHSPVLRIVIDMPGYEPSIDQVITVLKNIIPLLEENNIILAIENHDRFKVAEFAFIIENSDPHWVGICLDSVNSMGAAEGIEEVVKTLVPYTINLHVKDFVIRRVSHKMGFIIEGTPAGKGMLNIPWLIGEVQKHHYCESAILELWTPPEKELKATIAKENRWAEESIRYLKELL